MSMLGRDALLGVAAIAAVLLANSLARAESEPAWSEVDPAIAADLHRGAPLTVHIIVPLCDNRQIHCGGASAGDPRNLERNLFWGAIFGAKRFFDRKHSGYERVSTTRELQGVLERAVYRRWHEGARWGLERRVEQVVVLDAIDGAQIGDAVTRFWSGMTAGETVTVADGERERELTVHTVGYVGHNWTYEGIRTGRAKQRIASKRRALPSFVLSCESEPDFALGIENAGSTPLLLTREYIAPEGYAVEALVRALGRNATRRELRDEVVRAYAKWQNVSFATASRLFAPAR